MDFSTLNDASLLQLIANSFGKSDAEPILNAALSSLYDRYGRLVFSIAYHLVGDVETSEEITQDVFVRVCEGARGYQEQLAHVNTWLVSIARHRAIDELRRRSVRPLPSSFDWSGEDGHIQQADLTVTEGPEQEIEASLQKQAIREILAGLPTDQRHVLALAYFNGLSHRQIADMLGEPLGTVKSRIRMAMQKLREILEEREMVESS